MYYDSITPSPTAHDNTRKMWNNICKENLDKKHVVAIGGGYGGMELASELLKLGIPFTLIDKVTTEFDFVELLLGERVENLDELSFSICKKQTIRTSKVCFVVWFETILDFEVKKLPYLRFDWFFRIEIFSHTLLIGE